MRSLRSPIGIASHACAWAIAAWLCSCAEAGTGSADNRSPPQTVDPPAEALAQADGAEWAGAPDAQAVVIAPNGRDSNRCTLSAPCRSLERAREAVRDASDKVVYLRAGRYIRTQTFVLTSEDDGETWMTYPGDRVDSAVLDGGGTVAGSVIGIRGGSHIRINGLGIQHYHDQGIGLNAGPLYRLPNSAGIVVENCDIGFNSAAAVSWAASAIIFEGVVTGTVISHNYIHDLTSEGVVITAYNPGSSIDGTVIESNVVLRASQAMTDDGSIYVGMHNRNTSDHVAIRNNFVRDWGGVGVKGAHGIYVDDTASHVTVTGNIVGPPVSGAVEPSNIILNGGSDNTLTGNLLDLGASGADTAVVFYGDKTTVTHGMAGNVFSGNIVISGFAGTQKDYTYPELWRGELPTIANNVYHNYGGGQERTDGHRSGDAAPLHIDPRISGWTYTIAADSPVYAPPVNFPRLPGGWGPPGFHIPETGAPPSSPH